MELSENNFELLKEEVKKHLSQHENRYIHILGVINMAEKLAIKYNADVMKAKYAALLHDYSKYDNNIEALTDEEKSECEGHEYLVHAYLSAHAAYDIFKIDDSDIINAIKNHVIGRHNMSLLEKIIFIADFTEENRKYDDCIKCREILLEKGIDEAIIYSYESTMRHTNDPHPLQIEILKEYKEKIMLKTIIKALDKVKSENIMIYDMRERSPLFDYVIISTVSSSRQSSSVCEYIEDELKNEGMDVKNIEGKNTAWVVVDCHDVLVHVFTNEEREHFNLEKMYLDIPQLNVEDYR